MDKLKVQQYLQEIRNNPSRGSMWCYPLKGKVVSLVDPEKIIGLFSKAQKNTYVGNHEHPDYMQYPYEYDSYIGHDNYGRDYLDLRDQLIAKIRYLAKNPELVEAYEMYFLEKDLENV